MSIQTELTRITNAKAAIKTAIEGKGVTVPAGTLLDGMASLIESIEAGGGNDPSEIFDGDFCEYGTYTVARDSTTIRIPTIVRGNTHDIKFVMIWAEEDAGVLGMIGFRGKPKNYGEYGLQMLMTFAHSNAKYAICKPSTFNKDAQINEGSDSVAGKVSIGINGTTFDPYSNWAFNAGITYNYVIFAKSN